MVSAKQSPPAAPGQRRRFQFSLKAALLLTFLISLPLGGLAWRLDRARRQTANILALKEMGGSVIHRGGMGWAQNNWESRLHDWGYSLLGKDFFLDVTIVWVKAKDDEEAQKALDILHQFPHLERLNIFSDFIRAEDVGQLPCLSSLDYLTITGTQEYPALPDDLAPLHGAPKLRVLDLDQHPFLDPSLAGLNTHHSLRRLELCGKTVTDATLGHVASLTSLTELRLKTTSITDDGLRHLAALDELRHLRINDSSIQGHGFSAIGRMPAMLSLDVSDTRFDDEGMRQLRVFPNLDILRCENSQIHGQGIAPLVGATRISGVFAARCPITDEGLKELAVLPARVTDLDLSHSLITDRSVRKFTHVKNLDLAGTDVTDLSLDTLEQVQELKFLVVLGTKVTSAGVKRFQARRPKCMVAQ